MQQKSVNFSSHKMHCDVLSLFTHCHGYNEEDSASHWWGCAATGTHMRLLDAYCIAVLKNWQDLPKLNIQKGHDLRGSLLDVYALEIHTYIQEEMYEQYGKSLWKNAYYEKNIQGFLTILYPNKCIFQFHFSQIFWGTLIYKNTPKRKWATTTHSNVYVSYKHAVVRKKPDTTLLWNTVQNQGTWTGGTGHQESGYSAGSCDGTAVCCVLCAVFGPGCGYVGVFVKIQWYCALSYPPRKQSLL